MGDNIYKIQWDWMTDPVKSWADQKTQETANLIKTAQKNAEKDFNSRKNEIYKGQPDKTYQEMLNKDSVQALQQQLRSLGYDIGNTGADGIIGRRTKAALTAAEKDGYVLKGNKLTKKSELEAQQKQYTPQTTRNMSGATTNPGKYSLAANMPKTESNKPNENWEKAGQYVSNLFRAPVQATVDGALYLADRMGAPSNATNYLRDLNVSIPYRIKNAVHAGVNTLINDKTFSENYNDLLANPSAFTDYTTIRPLTNTNGNFSEEELGAIRDMAGKDFKISNADIKRVSEDGNYGGKGNVSTYFTPTKVVQTALGQTSGNAADKTITDIFDVNTVGSTAQKDNQMYIKMAKEEPGANYQTIRATMPFFNMIDIMPDKYKIKTKINFNE